MPIFLMANVEDKGNEIIIEITFKNIGNTNIIVDKDLVYLVAIKAKAATGERIPFTELEKPIGREPQEQSNRVMLLKPGAMLTRQISLISGYRVFEYGFAETPNQQYSITAYEVNVKLSRNIRPLILDIYYGDPGRFDIAYEQYTGRPGNELSDFNPRLHKTIEIP